MDYNPSKACSRCVMPANFPRITFNEEGVCSYCKEFDILQNKPKPGLNDLARIMEKNHHRNLGYDIVLGNSGGADSTYLVHVFATKLKARILSFTVDNGFLAPMARENIDKLNKKLGISHVYVNTDTSLIQKMYRSMILNGSHDFCSICINATFTGALKVATENSVPLVGWGLSTQNEPVFPVTIVNSGDYGFMKSIVSPDVKERDLDQFRYLSPFRVARSMFWHKIRHILLPDYIEWNRERFISELIAEYGWKDAPKSKPHFDCLAGDIMDYFWFRRFGFTKKWVFWAFKNRNGTMSREEAIYKITNEQNMEEPTEELNSFCDKLNVKRSDIQHLLDGTSHDCYHFKGYHHWMKRFNAFFWIMAKLRVLPPVVYQKYK